MGTVQPGSLMIRVVGLDPPKGVLRIAVYGSRKSYEARSNPAKSAAVEISSANTTVQFQGMMPGFYAVMLYHDANRNNKFDKFLGLPMEQYGFSNNAKPGLGPPDFDKTRFEIPPGQEVHIKIKAQ